LVVDLLLAKDAEGRTPFHYACRYAGNVHTLRFLLAQEHKLNSQKYTTRHDTTNDTHNHAWSHLEQRHGAFIDIRESSVWWSIGQLKIRDKFGRSPLIRACDQSHPEVVQFLFEEAGAQLTAVYTHPPPP
jgi:ankyrin repeat protein